ncbi:carbohydrate ABC transporter permease [Isoptericola halotolerans]|uniref:carbohydrate ABC transporter permease n=1 Tax=Isoptericola halotolerans TaxID=300560 RepID=UPI00388F9A93
MTTDTSTSPAPTKRDRRPGTGANGGRRIGSHAFLVLMALYFVVPLWFLVVGSTKTNSGLFVGSGGALWFNDNFSLVENIRGLFEHQGGIYWTWLRNSFIYALAGGVGATVLALFAGYGLAKYHFKGRTAYFTVLLGSVMVPLTALTIPTFVLLSDIGLINTMWAVILPSLLSPIGVYLVRVYSQDAIPSEMLDAGRVDGAGELRLFFQVALPLLRPAIVTVLLLTTVFSWNNFFLPLAVLRDTDLLPVTVGLNQWQALSNAGAGGEQVWNLIVTGALVSIIPLIAAFLGLQKYWQGGLSLGSVK